MPLTSDDSRQLELFRKELESLAKMLSAQENRLDAYVDELPAQLQKAVTSALKEQPQITATQLKYIEAATELQVQKKAFRSAVIEKTTVGVICMLIGLGLTGMGVIFMDFLAAHGWRR